MKSNKSRVGLYRLVVVMATILGVVSVSTDEPVAEAGVYFNDSQFTYKEYWASHDSYTAGCGADETSGGSWYIEPAGCMKSIDLDIPDDISGAIAAVVYVDLWRNRVTNSARFTINNGPQYRPTVGSNFSSTPFIATVPLGELQTGSNTLRFQEASGPYHVQDVMIRVYYDANNPIGPGPGSDVNPPAGQLTSVRVPGESAIDPTVGGTLAVDGNQVTLTATATDAAYVEFHAYYDGFDEDNDGITRDWHNFLRNNYGPGGVQEKPNGATRGHIGTDSTAPYQVTWNLPDVVSQSGVKFKIRVVDADGNVIEAPGGSSADFTLERSYSVESYTIPNFADQALYFNDTFPQLASADIDLPTDLNGADRAILLGNYWNSPDISINDETPFPAFVGNEDKWDTSVRELDVSQLRPGRNTIRWNYQPPGFGAMVEGPGPMIVIQRDLPEGLPIVTSSPEDVYTSEGLSATFTAAASGESPIVYQWLREGQPIQGATSFSYTTPALAPSDNGAKYSVRASNALGSAVSAEATAYVTSSPPETAPWWDSQFDFRVPLSAGADGVERTDKVISQQLNFTSLMASAGSGGPTFDPASLRVVEVDPAGLVIDDSVPAQFEPANSYDALSNAVGSLVWQLEGVTPSGSSRLYHVYFDKTSKGIPAQTFSDQITRTTTTDEGLPAYRFDLADGSQWYFHTQDGGGFSSIVDRDGNDWIGWNTAPGAQGDFRGFPNSAKPPAEYAHPGRPGTTVTTLLNEGPLRVTFETRAVDDSWITIWHMYPTYSEFVMTRASTNYWVQYEGTPGGEFDSGDFIRRADGLQVSANGTFEVDLPDEEWMYAADPADDRSFFMAHQQNDGSVESYRQIDDQMAVLAFGRGGNNLNFPYLQEFIGGKPQSFVAGLVDSVEPTSTGEYIRASYRDPAVAVGPSLFNGVEVGPLSDSFDGPTLDPMWTFVDPVGDTALTMTGSALQFDIPSGPGHDLWTGRNTAPRILQDVSDTDLDVSVAFESVPTLQSQGQGLLMVQDDDNWIRIAIVRVSGVTRVDVYKMVDGTATRIFKKPLPGVPLRYLRVIRSGDSWQFQRSWNGQNWYGAGSFEIPLELRQIGVYATSYNSGTSPGFVSTVDYFESQTSGGPVEQGPTISDVNVAATARGAVVTWTTDVAATTRLDHGPTVELQNSNVDATESTTHSVVLNFLACDSVYFVRPQSTSAAGTTTGQITTFTTDACSLVVSDDFSTGVLGDQWTVADPIGDAVVTLTSTNAIVSLPAGSDYNLFPGENNATRLRQEGPEGNFGVEAKFESVLDSRFQLQGIVVEEDDDSYLRFEIQHDGNSTKAYVASVLDDVVTVHYYGNLPTSVEQYLRVTRSGDTWSVSHSIDDLAWLPVVSFSAGIDSAYVGPYIGSTASGAASPPGFVGSVDYFFNLDSPIDPDDGGIGPDFDPPVISNVAVDPAIPTLGSATITWMTNEPATTRVEWGQTGAYGYGPLVENVAVINHTAVIDALNCGQSYNYRVQSTDVAGNTGSSSDMTFDMPACPPGAFSDNFDGPTLDSRWFVDDERGDGTLTPLNGLVSIAIPGGVRHDLTPTNNNAYRLLQPVADTDFQVQVGFESVVNFGFQLQGIAIEQDDETLVRFDLHSDGSVTRAFVGYLNQSQLQTLGSVVVPASVPGTLRVSRTGTNWIFEYSANDGATWQTIYTGTINMGVSRMGPFVGNSNPQAADIPAHTAFVDYFWSASDPIAITEPGITDGPQFTIFGGNGTVWDGQPLNFGTQGLAQPPDLNVMGRVTDPDGVTTMTYRVNGGDPVRMGMGTTDCSVGVSCTRRLAADGDFNADIDASLLTPGLNTITIRAVDGQFNAASIDIPVNFTSGNQWPLPYSVDWNSVSDIYNAAQPIDGRWTVEDGSLRTEEIGYDRLIAVGDGSWESYEVEVPITINSFDTAGYAFPSGGPGIGFIPHWLGHTQEDIVQPKYGFKDRLGALVWYRYRSDANSERFEIRDSQAALVAEDLTGRRLNLGTPYIFKLQVETGTATTGPTYRLKTWEQGTGEPFAWDITTTLSVGSPDQGSLALVAHHVDATFGKVEVRELTTIAPLVSPNSGTYAGLTTIDMTTNGTGGEVRYTLDGSEPTASSTLFSEPFVINQTTTVKARTFRSGFDPSSTTERFYDILPVEYERVTDGLEAEYRFDEGSGTTVNNSVAGGSALDLTVQGGSDVTWLAAEEALRINGPSLIRTTAGAKPYNNAVRSSQSLTVEMWIDPADLGGGDRTLVNIAPSNPTYQNLELAQSGTTLESALRTSSTNNTGTPPLTTSGAIADGLHQVVYVRRPNSAVEVFVDGVKVWDGTRSGSLAAWGAGYALGIGDTIERTNPWTGDIYLMAFYSDDLTAVQVAQNFQAGVLTVSGNAPPVVDAGPDVTVVEGDDVTMAATASDDGNPDPPGLLVTEWTQVSGPTAAVMADSSSATTDVTALVDGTYAFRWSAADGERTTVDEMEITVLPATGSAPPPQVSPGSGTYPGSVDVSMATSVPGATINFTLDGSEPTSTSAEYVETFQLTSDAVVKARVFAVDLDPSSVTSVDYVIGAAERVGEGLVGLYTFNESSGDQILDESSFGTPLDLVIDDVSRTTRVPSGLRIDQPTVIGSEYATKINSAIRSSNELTTEVWLDPADAGQLNAMIVNLSVNKNSRNAAIVQEGAVLDAYLRTKDTNYRGDPPTRAVDQIAVGLTQVVFTRATDGTTTLYVNGAVAATGAVAKTLGNWDMNARVHIGAERFGSKPWLGTFYLVAFYDRALTPAEVLQNFVVGDV